MRHLTTSLIFSVISPLLMMAAPFQNLDFERPHLPIQEVGFLEGLAVDAIPGWKPLIGSVEWDRVLLNAVPLSSARLSLFGPLTQQPNPNRNLYSLRLYSGDAFNIGKFGVAITQSGLISETSKSLRLEARILGEYHVTLDGAPISMSLSTTGTDFDVYYGDISSFSGRTAELKIETGVGIGFNQPFMYIDKIRFSTLVVPEPSSYALLALGLFGLGLRARHSRAR